MKDKKAYPFYKDLVRLGLDLDVINRLSIHLANVISGSDDNIMSPMARDHGPDVILAELDGLVQSKRYKLNSVLYDLEMDNKSKFGPRSEAVPWSERKTAVYGDFNAGDANNIPSDVVLLSNRKNLRPKSLAVAAKYLKNDTNSGLPFYTRKSKVKQRVVDKFENLMSKEYPCILFTRTTEQRKTRDVWGYPIADTLNEMRFYIPLLEFQRTIGYRSAINSPHATDLAMTKLIKRCHNASDLILVSIDFAKFDKSFRAKLQKIAFNYIESLFQQQYMSEISKLYQRFNTISLLTPDGILEGSHGVPSGSTFTNEVDSIGQAAIGLSSGFVSDEDLQIQGDDGVYLIPTNRYEDLILRFESCGLTVNKEKSYRSRDYAIYLQNLYHIDYMKDDLIGGIYPIYRALNRILFQEQWSNFEDYNISGRDYYAIRTICILENCKYHPLFEEFVKLILSFDKYSLDPSDQGIRQYVQMLSSSKGSGGILDHQYGDNVSGLKSFSTYKIIKGLS